MVQVGRVLISNAKIARIHIFVVETLQMNGVAASQVFITHLGVVQADFGQEPLRV